MKVTLRLFPKLHPRSSYDWEMFNGNIYIASYRDEGYTTKGNAKRAALRWAELLGLSVVDVEDEEQLTKEDK